RPVSSATSSAAPIRSDEVRTCPLGRVIRNKVPATSIDGAPAAPTPVAGEIRAASSASTRADGHTATCSVEAELGAVRHYEPDRLQRGGIRREAVAQLRAVAGQTVAGQTVAGQTVAGQAVAGQAGVCRCGTGYNGGYDDY